MLSGCALDKYMKGFESHNVSFHPHGRANRTTQNTGTPTDHCWTEGVDGFGLEMQGAYDYTYSSCYEVFNWCLWDTSPPKGMRTCSESPDLVANEQLSDLVETQFPKLAAEDVSPYDCGLGKTTWTASQPSVCNDWFKKYLPV